MNTGPFEFQQPFDGAQAELSESEKKEVAARFQAIIDKTLMENINSDSAYVGTDIATLLLTHELEVNRIVSIAISKQTHTNGQTSNSIVVHRIVGLIGRGGSHYSLDKETGVVIRHDIVDLPLDEAYMDTLENLEGKRGSEQQEAKLRNTLANLALEKEMGLNDQPVTLEEINKLVRIITEFASKM